MYSPSRLDYRTLTQRYRLPEGKANVLLRGLSIVGRRPFRVRDENRDVLHAPQTNRGLEVCSPYGSRQRKIDQMRQLGSPEQMDFASVLFPQSGFMLRSFLQFQYTNERLTWRETYQTFGSKMKKEFVSGTNC